MGWEDGPFVRVSDHGFGLSEDGIEAVFTRSFRDRPADVGRPGLGLGLYLSRRAAEQMGGWLTLERRPSGRRRHIPPRPSTRDLRSRLTPGRRRLYSGGRGRALDVPAARVRRKRAHVWRRRAEPGSEPVFRVDRVADVLDGAANKALRGGRGRCPGCGSCF